ncbi:hypothetical protein QQP08_020758 [Theobroma cacao]|nr:hypothetical protein QQP08_020758 [Theobroma cacao]
MFNFGRLKLVNEMNQNKTQNTKVFLLSLTNKICNFHCLYCLYIHNKDQEEQGAHNRLPKTIRLDSQITNRNQSHLAESPSKALSRLLETEKESFSRTEPTQHCKAGSSATGLLRKGAANLRKPTGQNPSPIAGYVNLYGEHVFNSCFQPNDFTLKNSRIHLKNIKPPPSLAKS